MKNIDINWDAFTRAVDFWETSVPMVISLDFKKYQTFLMEEYGIRITHSEIKVVDEKKYLIMLLRWA